MRDLGTRAKSISLCVIVYTKLDQFTAGGKIIHVKATKIWNMLHYKLAQLSSINCLIFASISNLPDARGIVTGI